MTIVSLRSQYVTWVQQDNATKNWFGKTGYLSLYGKTGRLNNGIVWFANPFPASGANVVRATLTVKTRAVSGTEASQIGVELADRWSGSFGQVTWQSRPVARLSKVSLTKSAPSSAGLAWTFDVTSLMQTVASGGPFYGFILSTLSQHQILVEGNMSADLDPRLEIEWTVNPMPPSAGAAASGQAIGTGSPILTWAYTDFVGGDVLASCQVRASMSQSMTPVVFDSGEVATTVPQMDLSAQPGWNAPAADTTVWWQVRCKDSSGLWSDWSDPRSWTWHPLPSVTLLQPTSGVFADPTPPIQWSYSGDMPQARWRASVSVLQGSQWVIVDASGMVVSSETSWTPTVGLASAGTVRIIVDVFDNRAREAVPGCPIYGSYRGDFTFNPSATIEVPKSIRIVENRPLPSVDLAWTRSQAPDRWDVYRDGDLLARHDGLDWAVGGNRYQMTDKIAPNGTHRWTIFAIQNGVACRSQTITATLRHSPTWLVDNDSDERVCIVGDTEHDMTMPETTTRLEPIGSRAPITITGAQYGYEGVLTGRLAAVSGMPGTETPQLWRDRLAAWKAQPGKVLYLLIEDLSIPVTISEVTWRSGEGYPGDLFYVSLRWHQIGAWSFEVPA